MSGRRPRVGIDARYYGHRDGLARYTQELLDHYRKLKVPYDLVALVKRRDVPRFRADHPDVELLVTNIPHYSLGEQLRLGREIEAADLDLMHFVNFNYPVNYRRPFIVTVHDLTLLTFAGRSRLSRLKSRPMRYVISRAARNSECIITISEYQKELITKTFGTSPEKIEVIYEAVERRFRPLSAAKVAAFRKRLGFDGPYLMYTGQWRPHKNLVRLLKALKRIRTKNPAKLVLVGRIDPAFSIIPETVKSLGLEDRVVFTDFVEDEELPLYYNAADLFVFPSLTEGFGLPPLEAMACGTTVASSSAPPMPEILGDAAAYFNPSSTPDMAKTILGLLQRPALRRKYRERGLRHNKGYSWQRTARQTADLYQRVLAERSRG